MDFGHFVSGPPIGENFGHNGSADLKPSATDPGYSYSTPAKLQRKSQTNCRNYQGGIRKKVAKGTPRAALGGGCIGCNSLA